MKKFTKENFNTNDVLNELMQESGVIVFENVYNLDGGIMKWREDIDPSIKEY